MITSVCPAVWKILRQLYRYQEIPSFLSLWWDIDKSIHGKFDDNKIVDMQFVNTPARVPEIQLMTDLHIVSDPQFLLC